MGNLGVYEFYRMPFGLTNAPAVFQKLTEHTRADLTNVLVYLDDIIIHSRTFETHLEHFRAVFSSLRAAGLKLKHTKCNLFQQRVKYVGHIISEAGIEADLDKIECVKVIAFTYNRALASISFWMHQYHGCISTWPWNSTESSTARPATSHRLCNRALKPCEVIYRAHKLEFPALKWAESEKYWATCTDTNVWS